MKVEAVIGLEVHAQLLTESKIFCTCSTQFGADPNTQTCPVCTGMPGVLPVLNGRAVEFALRAALATNCRITPVSRFARKNYFYPDLPKGYQISQYERPLAVHGSLEIRSGDNTRHVGITRIHMEEDAGKLLHEGAIDKSDSSLVDFNRTGVPLIEIVGEPDLRTPEEAGDYLRRLRDILRYLDICDGNMEQGSFRCDANISLRPAGSDELGVKTEVKNMNSFRNVEKALHYEIDRQRKILGGGGRIEQETLLWDADAERSRSMRGKEEAHDYRYFPDPDLIPLVVDDAWIESVRSNMPELPEAKRNRFMADYGLSAYDAEVLTASKPMAQFFEQCLDHIDEPKKVGNWIMGEMIRALKDSDREIDASPVSPAKLAGLLKLVDAGTISGKIAKEVFDEMFRTGEDPETIVESKGLSQISDEKALAGIIDHIIAENPGQASEFKAGKEILLGYFVGQVMKATKGKANPGLVNELLRRALGGDS